MKKFIVLILFSALYINICVAQDTETQQYKVACVGFYNLENLFDTEDDTTINDEEWLPTSSKLYTQEVYQDKLRNLSHILSLLGKEDTPDGIAVLGVAEVENRRVLEDLCAMPKIKDRNYKVVHYDSPDQRGIDVGLLYNPSYFKVLESGSLNVPLKNADGTPYATRDVLWVYGLFNGEPMHFFVNHWPSRRGGEEASAPGRALAAGIAKAKMDSIISIHPDAKIMLMGDLNDDPLSPSVLNVINAKGDIDKLNPGELFNPWTNYYKKELVLSHIMMHGIYLIRLYLLNHFLKKNKKGFSFKRR
ncbi:MAG: endonuclease/exonuclease/phosphatase family protein [Bacteroidetes bacterium]|nr:endonuclease/exonuclease/phosphatase family protein [Bacteroidota bacterium]